MTTFHENKTIPLETNLKNLISKSKVGDKYKGQISNYIRVNMRINNGIAWIKE